MVITVTFMAFKFADYAQVNQGVIASLFTSGVVFTTLLFWLVYKEKPSFWTFIGMLIIITGVVSVSLGKTSTYSYKFICFKVIIILICKKNIF